MPTSTVDPELNASARPYLALQPLPLSERDPQPLRAGAAILATTTDELNRARRAAGDGRRAVTAAERAAGHGDDPAAAADTLTRARQLAEVADIAEQQAYARRNTAGRAWIALLREHGPQLFTARRAVLAAHLDRISRAAQALRSELDQLGALGGPLSTIEVVTQARQSEAEIAVQPRPVPTSTLIGPALVSDMGEIVATLVDRVHAHRRLTERTVDAAGASVGLRAPLEDPAGNVMAVQFGGAAVLVPSHDVGPG